MSQNKYGKLVLDVLGAVQRSSQSQLEKDLLGAVISLEEHDPNGLGRPLQAIERPAEMPAVTQLSAPVEPPAPVSDPASQLSTVAVDAETTAPAPDLAPANDAAISTASTPPASPEPVQPETVKAEPPVQPAVFKP